MRRVIVVQDLAIFAHGLIECRHQRIFNFANHIFSTQRIVGLLQSKSESGIIMRPPLDSHDAPLTARKGVLDVHWSGAVPKGSSRDGRPRSFVGCGCSILGRWRRCNHPS
ncbi:hypothetical protein EMIT0P74_300007 [Pseudomonas sp. IT-P74]